MFRSFLRSFKGTLCAALLTFSLPVCAHAAATTTSYLMWQLPGSAISFPVYVYQNDTQVDYLYATTQQAFLGDYAPGATNANFTLYYQDSNAAWHGCNMVLTNGQIATTTTCPGAVINKPVANSNVYTLAMGAIAWPAIDQAPTNPTNVDYAKRKITFKNDTQYAQIRIGEHCTVSANPDNSNCANNLNLYEIAKGESATFYVDGDGTTPAQTPLAGLTSYGFTVTAYKKSASDDWVETGGYGKGETPYATKIEFTHKAVPIKNGAPSPEGSTNFDISAVDGYNISVTGYPAKPTYCTYTVPPENSNILGAGKYGPDIFLARITDSEKTCQSSSQLPQGYNKGDAPAKWDLTVTSNGKYQGCMSPCSYAKVNNDSNQDLFCCAGKYKSSKTCDQATGVIGANNSTYVTNLAPPVSTHVYRFAYDDAIGDFACPAQTDFMIIFGTANG